LVAERAFPAALVITNSARIDGANRFPSQSLPNQKTVKLSTDRLHHHHLSSSAVSVGIDPNENGLTHAQASFAPGAKAND
jgi:hypothetical protein